MSDGIAYGDYYLLGRLGTGGMAEVFLGKRLGDAVGGPLYAIKRLLTQFGSNPELVQRFQDESRIAKLLRHPNVAEVIETGVNNKQHFMVMEFIHGKDLKTVQQRARKTGARLPYAASAYIAAAIADALEFAHETEAPDDIGGVIVHRDLGPQKILISYEGVPKVIDFSVRDAKSRGIEGRLGSIKGRFGYLSPEQAISHPADRHSDIFSLGVILYEMTTGMAPFRGGSDAATLGKVARASYSAPELVNAGIPRGLSKIIDRAMQRESEKRYGSAGEMADALRAFIRDDGQVIDKAELARIMRELFFEDYERERVRVEQYRKLTPMAPAGSSSKPQPMADSATAGGPESSRTKNAQDERTTADDKRLASIDDDDDTGVNDDDEAAPEQEEHTDTGITGDVPDTGVHDLASDTGVHDDVPDTGVHDDVPDTGVHGDVPDTGVHDVADTGVHEVTASTEDPVGGRRTTEEQPIPPEAMSGVNGSQHAKNTGFSSAPTAEMARMQFEATPSVVASPPESQKPGDFNLTVEEVVPRLDDEPTGADDPVAADADTAPPLTKANPWTSDPAALTAPLPTPAVLGEGPTVVAPSLFSGESLFQIKTPSGKDPTFNETTKVFDGVAELVRRTQPSGFGVEVTKPDKPPEPAISASGHGARISEVIGALSPLAVATTVEGLNVATTVQPMHVATVIATPPEKAVTEVAQAKAKKKKGRGLLKGDGEEIADTNGEDSEFLDDEVFVKSGPTPDDVDMDAPLTTASPMPGAMLAERPDDLEEYEEVGRFFSRSDMITLVVAAVMGMLIMTASYVYALNVPLPDQEMADDR